MGDHASGRSEILSDDQTQTQAPSPEWVAAVEAGRLMFAREVTFMRGAVGLDGLPPIALPEIAFAGRSNVGKSSLINALCGRSTVARTSNTPGRTQELNFFDICGRLVMVDMPGYGFAKAPKDKVDAWTRLIGGYLRGRSSLRRCFLLVDSRHGLKDSDRQMMTMLDKSAVVYQVVLTKIDKLKASEVQEVSDRTRQEIASHVAAHPNLVLTSSEKGVGLADLRAEIVQLAKPETD